MSPWVARQNARAREECVRRARPRPTSAYLLFVAAGSPALGEEGFAPAGSIFAAGGLAFAAAVPAVAFSPLGTPAPPPATPSTGTACTSTPCTWHPRRLATMKLALPPGRALRQKPTSCSALHFLLVPRTGATTRLNAKGSGLVAITFDASHRFAHRVMVGGHRLDLSVTPCRLAGHEHAVASALSLPEASHRF